MRRGLHDLLTTQPGWKVVAEAANGRQAVQQAKKTKPSIVVMDLAMPEMNGLAAIKEILGILPKTEIVLLTEHHSEETIREVFKAGARGYVLKSDAGRDLMAAVKAVAQHKPFLTPRVAEPVLSGYLQASADPVSERGSRSLSSREQQVIQLLAEGKSNKEAAISLGISTKTVEAHRININRKLGLHSVPDLVRYAIRNGIVSV